MPGRIEYPQSRHNIGARPRRLYKTVGSLAPMTPPPADIAVDLALAERLVADQFPDLSTLPLRVATEGWDNVIFRLGDGMALRIPRREMAASLIDHEQRWLPFLAPLLPIEIPAPLRSGAPTPYFPYPWSVVAWVPGQMALHDPLRLPEAATLGAFLKTLHNIALPDDPPANPYRGGSLAERRQLYRQRLATARPELGERHADSTRSLLLEVFEMAAPRSSTWLHGDLHSKNVISRDGSIAAIIDWGDICTGDPATDLASLWILFEPEAHHAFWSSYGEIEEDLLTRARAWAVAFGLMLHDSHHEADPKFAAAGLTTIRRALQVPNT